MSWRNNVIVEQLHDTAMTHFRAHVVMCNNVIVEQLHDTLIKKGKNLRMCITSRVEKKLMLPVT